MTRQPTFSIEHKSVNWTAGLCASSSMVGKMTERNCRGIQKHGIIVKSGRDHNSPLKSFPLNHCTAEPAEKGSSYVTVPSPFIWPVALSL